MVQIQDGTAKFAVRQKVSKDSLGGGACILWV